MLQSVSISAEGEARAARGRSGRLVGVRGPGRLETRLACRAAIVLAMLCTAATVGPATRDLVAQIGPPVSAYASAALWLGVAIVATLAWATIRLVVEAENWGTVWVEVPQVAVVTRTRAEDPPTLFRNGAEARFWSILENCRVVAYIKDRDGCYLRVNPHWCRLFDPEGRGAVGKNDFALFPEAMATALARNDRIVLDAGVSVELEEVAPHLDGPHTYLTIKVPLFDAIGNACGLCGISSDITDREELERRLAAQLELARAANAELGRRGDELASANARLAELATTDGLTSLMNRRHFDEVIQARVETAFRDGTPLSVLMIDLDGFKAFNDAFGHPAGDRVLRRVAMILRDHVRPCDDVARYGGEEFVALLPDADEAAARSVAERIRLAVETWRWPDRPLTTSVGAATFGVGLGDAQDVIDRADRALYHSKSTGRNRVTHDTDLADASADDSGPMLVTGVGEGCERIAGLGSGR